MVYTCSLDTPLGRMTAAAEEEALVGLWFNGQKYYPAQRVQWVSQEEYPVFKDLQKWLQAYFAGHNPALNDLSFPLKPRGTAFRQTIWDILLTIPYGQTRTYGDIAKEYAYRKGLASMSAQAVGGAVGHNPISILIPCHRVIGHDKSLTGYAGGLDKKVALLTLEGVELSK
ncbi:MAG: methylated-DNA--[protein]-cysteine S-methyltransferase [Peptococcaceae bacterium]|nr:methylated-DNA--[protein]-cysteine S-methyltransferase [Peptococcaceae bacterium]